MFSINQKRYIANELQKILRLTNHPELPPINEEIKFNLHVYGKEDWSWADILNNSAVSNPTGNQWNENMEKPIKVGTINSYNETPRFMFEEETTTIIVGGKT